MKKIIFILLILLSIKTASAQVTPVEPSTDAPWTNNPYTKLYVDSPVEIAVVGTALDETVAILHEGRYKYILMSIALIGLAIVVIQGFLSGNILPSIAYIIILLLLYSASTMSLGRIQVSSYSFAHNWDAQTLNLEHQPRETPILLWIGLSVTSYFQGLLTALADNTMYRFSGVLYRQYPYTLAEGLYEVYKSDLGDIVADNAIRRYIQSCVAPAVAREVEKYGEVRSQDINDIVKSAEDLLIVDDQSREVMTCKEYWKKWKSILENDVNILVAKTEDAFNSTGKSAVRLEVARKVKSIEKVVGKSWKDIFFSVKMIKLIKDGAKIADDNSYFYEKSSGVMKFISGIFAKLTEWLGSFFGRLGADIAFRAMPYINAFTLSLALLAFPIILAFAFLPGGAKILFEYFRSLVWIQSWLPFMVLVKQLTNAFIKMNLINKVISAGTAGIIDEKVLSSISMSKDMALTVGSILIFSVPIITYGIIARGSLSGMLSAASSAVSTTARTAGSVFTGAVGIGIGAASKGAGTVVRAGSKATKNINPGNTFKGV